MMRAPALQLGSLLIKFSNIYIYIYICNAMQVQTAAVWHRGIIVGSNEVHRIHR